MRNVIFGVSEKWVKNSFYQLKNMEYLNYKNFRGTIEYSSEDKTHFGKIVEIKDLINYEGTTKHELKEAFIQAVNDYIETTKQR